MENRHIYRYLKTVICLQHSPYPTRQQLKQRFISAIRAQEKITCYFIALSFGSGLVDLIELDRRRSLSYAEDSASEERTKMG